VDPHRATSSGPVAAPPDGEVAALVGPWLWSFPTTYLVHFVEESFAGVGFDRWVARVSGHPLTRTQFRSLNLLYGAAMVGTVAAVRGRPARAWMVPGLGTVVALNGAGHVVGSVVTRTYSPGAVSGALLWFPLGVWAIQRSRRALSRAELRRGVAAGLAVSAGVVITAAVVSRSH